LSYRPADTVRCFACGLPRLLVFSALVAARTVFLLNEPVGVFLLVFLCRVVPPFAFRTRENDGIPHDPPVFQRVWLGPDGVFVLLARDPVSSPQPRSLCAKVERKHHQAPLTHLRDHLDHHSCSHRPPALSDRKP